MAGRLSGTFHAQPQRAEPDGGEVLFALLPTRAARLTMTGMRMKAPVLAAFAFVTLAPGPCGSLAAAPDRRPNIAIIVRVLLSRTVAAVVGDDVR